jgi:hypothetical protein
MAQGGGGRARRRGGGERRPWRREEDTGHGARRRGPAASAHGRSDLAMAARVGWAARRGRGGGAGQTWPASLLRPWPGEEEGRRRRRGLAGRHGSTGGRTKLCTETGERGKAGASPERSGSVRPIF